MWCDVPSGSVWEMIDCGMLHISVSDAPPWPHSLVRTASDPTTNASLCAGDAPTPPISIGYLSATPGGPMGSIPATTIRCRHCLRWCHVGLTRMCSQRIPPAFNAPHGHCISTTSPHWNQCLRMNILAEGAIALSVTLSGGALFAS